MSRSGVQTIKLKDGFSTVQTWTYDYQSLGSVATYSGIRTIHGLTDVIPPEGDRWEFQYWSSGTPESKCKFCLKEAASPTGADIEYTYDHIPFDTGGFGCQVWRPTLQKKVISGRGLTTATWNYDYFDAGEDDAKTVVDGPLNSEQEYVFHGWKTYTLSDPDMWLVGRIKSSTKEYGGETVEETYTWKQTDRISFDWRMTTPWTPCSGNRQYPEIYFASPDDIVRTVTRNGNTYTTTQTDFDSYGNPETIDESGQVNRTTEIEYWYDTPSNLLGGRVEYQEATPGGRERFWYDGSGLMTRHVVNASTKTGTNGIDTDYHYDAAGNLTKRVIENGTSDREARFEQYVFGVAERDEFPKTSGTITVERDVDYLGNLNWEEDGDNNKTHFQYDDLGRMTRVEPPIGLDIEYDYANDLSEVTVSRGSYDVKYFYDGLGRLTKKEDLETEHRTEYDFNVLGVQTEKRIYTRGNLYQTFEYDDLGRLTKSIQPDGLFTEQTYSGNVVTVTDPLGHATSYTWDAFGDPGDQRLAKVVEANGNTWNYQYYSTNGLLETVEAPLARGDVEYEYTYQHFLDEETRGEYGTIEYFYSAAGDMTRRKKGGETVDYDYDRVGWLSRIDPPGTNVEFKYDNAGRRTKATRGGDFKEYDYDNAGRLTKITNQTSGVSRAVSYSYDTMDRRTKVTYPSGQSATYNYDSASRVTKVTPSYVNNVTYNANGQIGNVTRGNGVITVHTYTDNLRLLNQHDKKDGVFLKKRGYRYNDDGNMTKQFDKLGPYDRAYSYDWLHRIRTSDASSIWGAKVTYLHTALGDRASEKRGGLTDTYNYSTTTNRLTSITGPNGTWTYGYDAAGRMTTSDTPEYGLQTIVYSELDEVETITNSSGTYSYVYNGDHERVKKTLPDGSSTIYVRDDNGRTLAEYTGTGVHIADYIYFDGRIVAKRAADGTKTYYHPNHVGTTELLTDESGASIWDAYYDPFGLEFLASGTSSPYEYTNHEFDDGTGFYDFGVRLYDPKTSRFLSPDPVAPGLREPRSHSRYSHAFHNPLVFEDPDGRAVETAWDLVNIGMGAASFFSNVKNGNVGAALLDFGGIVVDGVAAAVPFVPGGASTAIKAGRAVDKGVDVVQGFRRAERLEDGTLGFRNQAELVLDTNVVISDGRRFVENGDNVVKSVVTDIELRDIHKRGNIKGAPNAASDIPSVELPSIHTRINVRGGLAPGSRGNFADGIIGATAIDRGSTLVTRDKALAEAVKAAGGRVADP